MLSSSILAAGSVLTGFFWTACDLGLCSPQEGVAASVICLTITCLLSGLVSDIDPA